MSDPLKRPVTTWLPESDYEKLVLLAKASNVTVALYLRSIVTDALYEETVLHVDLNGASAEPLDIGLGNAGNSG